MSAIDAARALDLPVTWGRGYEQLLDLAVAAYWRNRRPVAPDRPACGSDPGYRIHLRQHELPCEKCRTAHKTCRAINRRRQQRRTAA